jgi:hypothetical protein
MLMCLLGASLLSGILLSWRFAVLILLPAHIGAVCVTLIFEALAHAPLHDTMSTRLVTSMAVHVLYVLVALQIGYVLGVVLHSLSLSAPPSVRKALLRNP